MRAKSFGNYSSSSKRADKYNPYNQLQTSASTLRGLKDSLTTASSIAHRFAILLRGVDQYIGWHSLLMIGQRNWLFRPISRLRTQIHFFG